jgi:hypothetical protein
MTGVDEATAPFAEAEIKEHQAALIRQMIALELSFALCSCWWELRR